MTAVNRVELTKVVTSGVLPTWITLVCTKPVPVIVSVTAADPAGRVVGLMEEIEGAEVAGAAGLLETGAELAADEAPPQPLTNAVEPRPQTTRTNHTTDIADA